MYFSARSNTVLARLFHHEAREDARWEVAAVRGEISQATQRCLPFVSAYWASNLINPSLLDLGESDSAFLLAATCFVTLSEPTPAQIKQFRETLERMIVEKMYARFASLKDDWDEQPTRADIEHCSLEVDYAPYGPLAEAARAAGFDRLGQRFPWKTTMRIERGEVRVKRKAENWQALYPQDKKRVKRLLSQVEQYCKSEA